MIYFTSDTHFLHSQIIEYCGRPFKNVEHMDIELVRRWNERVKPEDTVFHLGDFAWKSQGKYKKLLNGNIIHIKGNHDKKVPLLNAHIVLGSTNIWCCHDPANYNHKFKINIVGHVHNDWKFKKEGKTILVNVGVDMWNFYPIKWNEILKELNLWRQDNE